MLYGARVIRQHEYGDLRAGSTVPPDNCGRLPRQSGAVRADHRTAPGLAHRLSGRGRLPKRGYLGRPTPYNCEAQEDWVMATTYTRSKTQR
jgi:hypothetical protein